MQTSHDLSLRSFVNLIVKDFLALLGEYIKRRPWRFQQGDHRTHSVFVLIFVQYSSGASHSYVLYVNSIWPLVESIKKEKTKQQTFHSQTPLPSRICHHNVIPQLSNHAQRWGFSWQLRLRGDYWIPSFSRTLPFLWMASPARVGGLGRLKAVMAIATSQWDTETFCKLRSARRAGSGQCGIIRETAQRKDRTWTASRHTRSLSAFRNTIVSELLLLWLCCTEAWGLNMA